MRIAVVGTGIAGLASAWLLSDRHSVTVFEAERRIGGHSNTVAIATPAGEVPVDTGFMVYNEHTYPLLTQLFAYLGIATRPTSMSFSASIGDGSVEYGGGSLRALLGQPANLVNPTFVRMLVDIVRFNRTGLRYLERGHDHEHTLGEFLSHHGFGRGLGEWYLLPMAAAIWSAPVLQMLDYPARSFLRFFANHGLLSINGHHPWRTVCGGSREYVRRMVGDLGPRIRIATPVTVVSRRPWGVELTDASGGSYRFDHVVMACHADQTRALIGNTTPRERELLAHFGYQQNRAVVHSDERLMPRRRAVWSSWNYLASRETNPQARISITYWMNSLQSLACRENLFVSLNPLRDPDPALVHGEIDYAHPVFTHAAVRAQAGMQEIQGDGGIWYAGAWLGNGFHEDGLRAAVAVARALGAAPPWEEPSRPAASGVGRSMARLTS